jgi:hypothetical protein
MSPNQQQADPEETEDPTRSEADWTRNPTWSWIKRGHATKHRAANSIFHND